MTLKKRRRRVLGVILVLVVGMAGCGWWWVYRDTRPPLVTINVAKIQPKITIANELRMMVQPVAVSNREVSFKVRLESYQNTDAVRANPIDIMMLTIQEDIPFRDATWSDHHHSDYRREGVISFKVDRLPQLLRLSVFEQEERLFEWDIPH